MSGLAASVELYKTAGFGDRPLVTSVRDVTAAEFITTYAAHLKKAGKLQLPEWVDVVKTANGRELPPLDPDWYYVRAASVARKIYLNGGIGVGALARWYGKTKTVSTKPQRHGKASRSVIRHVLIQLEEQGVIEKTEKGGRIITKEGQKDLDTIARTAVEVADQ